MRISDQGGGISRKDVNNVWNYTYTTASTGPLAPPKAGANSSTGEEDEGGIPLRRANVEGRIGGGHVPMHGFGYGLPISRLYASYFGGDIRIQSMEGYGTDIYVYLGVLSDNKPAGASLQAPMFATESVYC